MARYSNSIYGQEAVSAAIDELQNMGYTFAPLPASLLSPCVAIAPDDRHYNYVFEEIYLNEWASGYRVYRRAKLPKRILNAIDEAEQYDCAGY